MTPYSLQTCGYCPTAPIKHCAFQLNSTSHKLFFIFSVIQWVWPKWKLRPGAHWSSKQHRTVAASKQHVCSVRSAACSRPLTEQELAFRLKIMFEKSNVLSFTCIHCRLHVRSKIFRAQARKIKQSLSATNGGEHWRQCSMLLARSVGAGHKATEEICPRPQSTTSESPTTNMMQQREMRTMRKVTKAARGNLPRHTHKTFDQNLTSNYNKQQQHRCHPQSCTAQ